MVLIHFVIHPRLDLRGNEPKTLRDGFLLEAVLQKKNRKRGETELSADAAVLCFFPLITTSTLTLSLLGHLWTVKEVDLTGLSLY